MGRDRRIQIKPLEVLTREDLDRLHADTLTVLDQVGVEVHDAAARELLQAAGARVEGVRARIDADLVARAVASAPKEAEVYTRGGEPALHLAPGHVYYGTGSDTTWFLDAVSGERRDTSLDSVRMMARLTQALPNLDFVMSMGRDREAAAEVADQRTFAAMVESASKPIVFTAQSGPALASIARICAAVAGGAEAFRARPFAMLYAMPTSPLMHSAEALATVLLAAEAGIPAIYSAAPMLGGTGPITLAGSLTLANAEMLSGLVIQQLHRPGAGFIHGPIIGPLDMHTMVNAYCGPETTLLSIAEAQLARHYGLPVFALAGASDAKTFDQQAASEATLSLLASSLAGGNLIHDVGYLESGLCASPDLLVFCDEVIDQIRYVLAGMEVSADSSLLSDIIEVGPGGNFLAQSSTVERFRSVLWSGPLTDRARHDEWQRTGARDMGARVRERVRELLAAPDPAPLEEATRAEVWRLAGGG